MTPLLLLRGLARHSGHWGSFLPQLQQLGFNLLTPDTPGNGIRYREKSPGNIEDYVDDLDDNLQAELQHIPKPVLVGISMGGMIATSWAQRHPEKFSGLIIINTSFGRFSPPWKRLRISALQQLWKAGKYGSNRARERAILEMISNDPLVRENQLNLFTEMAREFPLSPINFMAQLWASSQFKGPEVKPNLPILVVTSDGDRMVNPECSQMIAKKWNVKIESHPGAGHDLPLDAPEWLAITIKRWIEGLPK